MVSLLLHAGRLLCRPQPPLGPGAGCPVTGGGRKDPWRVLEERFCVLGWAHPHIYDLNLYSACCIAVYIVHAWACKYVVLCVNKTSLFWISHCRISCPHSLCFDVKCWLPKPFQTGFRVTFFSCSKIKLNWWWLKSKTERHCIFSGVGSRLVE